MKRVLKWFFLCLGVTAVSFFILRLIIAAQGIDLSVHGQIAMALGTFFTMAVGVLLMALLFHSHKHGHDEAAYELYSETDRDKHPDTKITSGNADIDPQK